VTIAVRQFDVHAVAPTAQAVKQVVDETRPSAGLLDDGDVQAGPKVGSYRAFMVFYDQTL
jgi:hypothetical protein